MTSTGHLADRTTASVTLPRNARAAPVWAWELITIKSHSCSAALVTIASALDDLQQIAD